MKNKIRSTLKTNRHIYNAYSLVFSVLIRTLGLFIRIDTKLVLINSFAGKRYDDSPRAMYEYMRYRDDFKDYKFVWAFEKPSDFSDYVTHTVKIDTLQYFLTALKAKYWITNSAIERGLRFKKSKTVYINTWHGSPIKKMGIDTDRSNNSFASSSPDYFLAQSKHDIDVFSRAFNLPRSTFRLTGLPRNDELANAKKGEIAKIKKQLGIPANKKVILYAPTYRDPSSHINEKQQFQLNPLKWQEALGSKYVILLRAHYEVIEAANIDANPIFHDVSLYPKLNDLLLITDVLISDYSSIIIDFSIRLNPIFCYVYDINSYIRDRGLYFDLYKALSDEMCFTSEENLLSAIKVIGQNNHKKIIDTFRHKYVQSFGHATEQAALLIGDKIEQ